MPVFLQRWQRGVIKRASQERRVLLLAGPRQCGKTTLLKHLDMPDIEYRTLDDEALRVTAEVDPQSFVTHDKAMLVIDEVQRVPSLLTQVKQVVDDNPRPGQFLLTGSVNIPGLPSVNESLAGRIAKIRLRTLSEGEIKGRSSEFLLKAFNQDFSSSGLAVYGRDDVLDIAFRGGFPEVIKFANRARRRWHNDYINALLERDLKDIANIRRKDAMDELVKVLAAWSSKFMDISAIGKKMSIRRPTLESYINALEMLFIVERVPPWAKTDYQRVAKRSKSFFTDSGLMASILKWREDDVRLNADRIGKLFETFVFAELSAQLDMGDGEYSLFHYHDREKREIDFLVERDDGALLGIEVKASLSFQKSDFKHLKWFRDNLAGDHPFVGIVLYAGKIHGSMGKNLHAVPFGTLW